MYRLYPNFALTPSSTMQTVRVWDLPTRLFHWALAACVIGLVITANVGGSWMTWHGRLGYTVLCLLLFRIVWGLVGGHLYYPGRSRCRYGPRNGYRRGQPGGHGRGVTRDG